MPLVVSSSENVQRSVETLGEFSNSGSAGASFFGAGTVAAAARGAPLAAWTTLRAVLHLLHLLLHDAHLFLQRLRCACASSAKTDAVEGDTGGASQAPPA